MAEQTNRAVLDTLGITVSYAPAAGGGPHTIQGIFDNGVTQVDSGLEVADLRPRPTLMVRISDLPARPKRGDRVTANGTQYTVEETREDGQGGTVLMLYKT